VLHHRQEAVLLGAVEAMDLVDKEQCPLPGLATRARLIEHLLEVGDAGIDRRDLLEVEIGLAREQPRHGGLAGAGRPPEYQRAERARGQHARERTIGTEQMVLSHHVGEARRAQLVGERPWCVRIETRRREQACPRRFGARAHKAKLPVICWPPRTMVTRQVRLGSLVARSRSRVRLIFSPLTETMMSPG